ncbi:DUF3179 domain-containing (seleno)protein [Candidatus Haliotispira prima]|uniref:DUF3179 domain-containing (Seleno)protein n=1 Tax=Candidatus Haliotispira prima TaxID=3034016 RepID=A0ABY8MJG8_9SPIO|nr:DUF3179 domain-containing (seleno)protein [Candidatus Haliotispira prima]
MQTKRVTNKEFGPMFKPIYTNEYINIKDILEHKVLTEDSQLIVFKIDSKHLAFSKHRMAFHHIAQGYVNKSPYMLTFCVICNSGMVMNPVVNNKMLHFYISGSYNGMLLMSDKETGSYWDHITGECISGKHKGCHLEILQSHQILTLKEVVEQYPDCLYGEEKMNFLQKSFAKFANRKADTKGNGFLPPGFKNSMPTTMDNRLPQMEMGLGIWGDKTARFYPSKIIKEHGNYLFDKLNGKDILVYISPTTDIPSAIYIKELNNLSFSEDTLILSNGNYIKGGNLYSSNETKLDVNKPNQVFLRWYGFVLTFPNCEVFHYPA